MKKFSVAEIFGHLGLGLMTLIWLALARSMIVEGGFYMQHPGTRRSRIPYEEKFFRVDGPEAIVVAYIFLSLAAIGLALIMRRFGAPKWAQAIASALILGWPLAYHWMS